MKRALTAICSCLLVACATAKKGDVDLLKPTLDAFHGKMRWKDFVQLPKQLVPDRREAFVKGANARDDEKNLFVTDYQLEDCTVKADDQTEAVCLSKVSWYRLPSTTEKTVIVATTLKWIGGQWLVERQSGGPFAEELSTATAATAEGEAAGRDGG